MISLENLTVFLKESIYAIKKKIISGFGSEGFSPEKQFTSKNSASDSLLTPNLV